MERAASTDRDDQQADLFDGAKDLLDTGTDSATSPGKGCAGDPVSPGKGDRSELSEDSYWRARIEGCRQNRRRMGAGGAAGGGRLPPAATLLSGEDRRVDGDGMRGHGSVPALLCLDLATQLACGSHRMTVSTSEQRDRHIVIAEAVRGKLAGYLKALVNWDGGGHALTPGSS